MTHPQACQFQKGAHRCATHFELSPRGQGVHYAVACDIGLAELRAEIDRLQALPLYGDREVSDLKVRVGVLTKTRKNLLAENAALRATVEEQTRVMGSLAKLYAHLIEYFFHDDHLEWEVWDFEELAEKCGLLYRDSYDPDKHGKHSDCEPGDPYYVQTDFGKQALTVAEQQSEDRDAISTEKLEPCPFCGTAPAYTQFQVDVRVGCYNELCGVNPVVKGITRGQAILNWNRASVAWDAAKEI